MTKKSKHNELAILKAEWQRLCNKYGYGCDYEIVCNPKQQNKNGLPWDTKSIIRGEVKQKTRQICLYDDNLDDKLECLRHEYFEIIFNALIEPYILLYNTFEQSVHKLLKTQKNVLQDFMKDTYFNKEVFINKFVHIETESYNKTRGE